MPLEVTFGGLSHSIGPSVDQLHITPQKLSVYWHGDEAGKAVVQTHTGARAEFSLARHGDQASYGVPVVIAPVEVGQPTTEAEWPLKLTRT